MGRGLGAESNDRQAAHRPAIAVWRNPVVDSRSPGAAELLIKQRSPPQSPWLVGSSKIAQVGGTDPKLLRPSPQAQARPRHHPRAGSHCSFWCQPGDRPGITQQIGGAAAARAPPLCEQQAFVGAGARASAVVALDRSP